MAVRSAVVATAIVLFVALVASGTLVTWRISTDAIAITGGVVLLMSAIRALTSFHLAAEPVPAVGPAAAINLRWMGGPVLSPLAIPSIVTPIGVVVLYFSGLASGDPALQGRLVGLLLAIMGLNLVAMLCARPIMRAVELPVLQVIGWVFSALQAGLAVEVLIGAVRRLGLVMAALAVAGTAGAQALDPRAFAPAPIGTTIVLAGAGGSKGSIFFDPSVGVADVAADLRIVTTGPARSAGLAGSRIRCGAAAHGDRAFKPEIGVTRPVGRWTLEAATGVWLFTTNDAYFRAGCGRSRIRWCRSRGT